MAEKEQAPTNQQGEAGPKKGGKLSMVIIFAVAILGAGGFVGWTQLKGGSKTPDKTPPPPPPPLVTLKPFVVNLQDPGDMPRYLKIEFDLELRPGSDVKEVESRMSELRDAIIVLLGSKRSDELATVEGKDRLKDEILTRVNSRLHAAIANRVFFKEFIVQ